MEKTQQLFQQISHNAQVMGVTLLKSFTLATILSFALPATAGAQTYRLETLAQGLNFPWSVDFLPNGDLLVAELEGTLRRIGTDGSLSDPITGVPTVYRDGQGGLFDVLLDKDFANNNTLYLSYILSLLM